MGRAQGRVLPRQHDGFVSKVMGERQYLKCGVVHKLIPCFGRCLPGQALPDEKFGYQGSGGPSWSTVEKLAFWRDFLLSLVKICGAGGQDFRDYEPRRSVNYQFQVLSGVTIPDLPNSKPQ